MENELFMALIKLRRDVGSRDREKALEGVAAVKNLLPCKSGDILYKVMVISMTEGERLINEGSFDNAYDLIDAVHCLPEIAASERRDMGAYWERHILVYREKWRSYLFDGLRDEILKM